MSLSVFNSLCETWRRMSAMGRIVIITVIAGVFFVITADSLNFRPAVINKNISHFESNAWGRVNGLSESMYSSVSNIIAITGGGVKSKTSLLELSEQLLSLNYKEHTCKEIQDIIVKYEEVVLYLCLGLAKANASESDISNVIIGGYYQLFKMRDFLSKQSYEHGETLEKTNAKRMIEKQIETYIRFFETVGVRLIFERYGSNVQKKFLQRWDEEKKNIRLNGNIVN